MEKELQGLEDGPKAKIDSLKVTLKQVPYWKTPGHDCTHGFWFKKFTSINDRLTIEMNSFFFLVGGSIEFFRSDE